MIPTQTTEKGKGGKGESIKAILLSFFEEPRMTRMRTDKFQLPAFIRAHP